MACFRPSLDMLPDTSAGGLCSVAHRGWSEILDKRGIGFGLQEGRASVVMQATLSKNVLRTRMTILSR